MGFFYLSMSCMLYVVLKGFVSAYVSRIVIFLFVMLSVGVIDE